ALPHRRRPPGGGKRGIWEDPVQAQGNTPSAPRGGLCGCLAVRQTLLAATGGTYRLGKPHWPNLPGGPPLGALRRCLRGAHATRSRRPTALWGIQEGKADVTRGETGERRTSSEATRAHAPADRVT